MVIRNGDTLIVEDCDVGMHHGSVDLSIDGRHVGSGGDLDYANLRGYVTEVKLNLRAVSRGSHTLVVCNGRGDRVPYAVRVRG